MTPESSVLEHRQPSEEDAARLLRVARQRQRTCQDVAWRKHAELVAQHSRAAAAIEHRDDRVRMDPRIGLEAAEQARQTGAAPQAADLQFAEAHSPHSTIGGMTISDAVRAVEQDLREI